MTADESGRTIAADTSDAVRALFGPFFDDAWYLETYPEVAKSGDLPLAHYLRSGAANGHAPNRLFDPSWYLDHCGDAAGAAPNPLLHYLRFGLREGRSPHPLFRPAWYLDRYPDVAESGKVPLAHYLAEGAAKGYAPNPFFDPCWYREQHPEVAAADADPLAHYLREGAAKGYAPSLYFDVDLYIELHPHAADNELSPLEHCLRFEIGEGPLGYPDGALERFRKRCIGPHVASGRTELAIRLLDQRERLLSAGAPIAHAECFALSSVREAVRAKGWDLLHEERGESVGAGPPVYVGEPEQPTPAPVSAPGRYIAVLKDVTVIGGTRFVIDDEGRLLHDEEAASAADRHVTVKYSRAWRAPDASMVLQFDRAPSPPVATGIHLMLENDHNYFHFIVETLPRLAYLNALGVDAGAPLIITGGLHANLRAALEILNPQGRRIIEIEAGAACKVDRLIYPSDLSNILDVYDRPERRDECVISTRWMRSVRESVLAAVCERASFAHRRLYVRRGRTYRAVTNESLMEEKLSTQGFEIVSPEELPFAEQVRLFAGAEFVVMPTGAAVTNIAWCRPETRILVLLSDHPFLQPTLWQFLAESADLDISFMRGPRAHANSGLPEVHDDFAIDVDALSDYVGGARRAGAHLSV